MNEETDPEPQLDPPQHINNREHYVGVTTITFSGVERNHSNRPTWPIPNHIWTRKFICHGDVRL
jgi:hypothetical protein